MGSSFQLFICIKLTLSSKPYIRSSPMKNNKAIPLAFYHSNIHTWDQEKNGDDDYLDDWFNDLADWFASERQSLLKRTTSSGVLVSTGVNNIPHFLNNDPTSG